MIVSSGASTQTIAAIKLDKQKFQLGTTPRFTRGYIVRTPKDSLPLLVLVRSQSATKRTLQPFSLVGTQTFQSIESPRKLIVGSALVMGRDGKSAEKGLFFQDLKLAKVTGYLLSDLNSPHNLIAISRNSRIVLSQYSYKTR